MKINKDILLEGKYDSITRMVVNDILRNIKKTEDELDEQHIFSLPYDDTGNEYYFAPNLKFEVDLSVFRTTDDIKYNGVSLPYHVNTFISVDDVLVCEVMIDESYGKKFYEEIYYKINEDVRHEIEHFTQHLALTDDRFKDRSQPSIPNTSDYDSTFSHHMDPSEVEALVRGFYRKARVSKKPLDIIIIEDLNQEMNLGNINKEEAQELFKTLLNYARRRLPNAIYSGSEL
jgi:hypothetical protein